MSKSLIKPILRILFMVSTGVTIYGIYTLIRMKTAESTNCFTYVTINKNRSSTTLIYTIEGNDYTDEVSDYDHLINEDTYVMSYYCNSKLLIYQYDSIIIGAPLDSTFAKIEDCSGCSKVYNSYFLSWIKPSVTYSYVVNDKLYKRTLIVPKRNRYLISNFEKNKHKIKIYYSVRNPIHSKVVL